MKTVFVKCPVCRASAFHKIAFGQDFEYNTSVDIYQFVRCHECNVIYLNPRPDVTELDRIYPVQYAPYTFETSRGLTFRIRRILEYNKIRNLRKLFKSDAEIIDSGCGGITFLYNLRRFGSPHWKLWGNDISSQVVNTIRESGFFAIQGRFEDINMPPGSFDGIIFKQVIEHLESPQVVLRKSHELLRPGGVLVIETPNSDAWDAKIFQQQYWGGYHFPRHWTIFDAETLNNAAKEAGFILVQRKYMLSPSFWVQSIHHLLKHKSAPVWIYELFTHKNPMMMSLAVLLDCLQIVFAGKTSNLQMVFKKP